MTEATVMATFVIVFRETLEAGLIVGIILAMLAKLNARQYSRYVWISVGLAVLASAAVGGMLGVSTQAVQGHWKKVIEGGISLVACGVLTWMVFWMDRQAKQIRPEIESELTGAVSRRELPAIIALPFLAVFREGAETVLFLQAVAIQSSQSVSIVGGLLGAALAVAITAAVFMWGLRLPMKTLFRSTGLFLLLIAAGLLAYGIHELQELGWLPMTIYPIWNTNHILNEKVGVGAFLKALFGYNGNPSLLEVVGYVAYLVGVGYSLRRSGRASAPGRT